MAALDTNILVYAEDASDILRSERCRVLITELAASGSLSISAQALAETHHVLTRKLRLSSPDASTRIRDIMALAEIVPTNSALISDALSLTDRHHIPTFDAIILAAAAEARCDILYSEDFQHGFVWRGVEIVNPFV